MRRRVFLVGGAAVLAACGEPDDSNEPGTEAISLLTTRLPETLNPVAGFGNTGMGKVNEGLLTLRGRPGLMPELVPNLAAADPEVSPDGRTWTVRIRPGVEFSDGTALTSGAVVATYRAVKDVKAGSPVAGDLANLRSVVAKSDDTVVFTLAEPQVSFRTALLLGIAPAALITPGQPVGESPLAQKPVGTGPYLVSGYSPARLVLTANEKYRGGAPQLKRITYVPVADDDARARRMRAGGFDGAVLPPRLAQPFQTGLTTTVIPASSADWRGLSLPPENLVTADPAVRVALNLGVDRESLITGALAGYGRPAHTFVSPEYGDFHDPTAVFAYDQRKAKAALDAAGWRRGRDGIRVKNGRRAGFTLMYQPGDLVRRDLSAAFASAVRPLGVDVTPEAVEIAEARSRIDRDALLLGGGDTPYDVDTQLYRSLHSSYPAAGAWYDNPSRYRSARMDAELERGRTGRADAERIAAYHRVQALYVEEPSMVLLAFLDQTYVQTTAAEKTWVQTKTLFEPHDHGTAWGPWARAERWRRR